MLALKHRYDTYVGEVNKTLQKSLLNPVLSTFSEALMTALSIPDSSHASDARLKTQVPYISRKSEYLKEGTRSPDRIQMFWQKWILLGLAKNL
jgi:hypothetical protein